MTNKQDVINTLYCSVDGQNIVANYTSNASSLNDCLSAATLSGSGLEMSKAATLWSYWRDDYYPYVIKESYPVYIQEKSMDKGKQAFELLKALMDKNLVKVEKVKDFIEAMDTILKTL